MSLDVGTLQATLELDDAAFRSGVDDAHSAVDDLDSAVSSLTSSLSDVTFDAGNVTSGADGATASLTTLDGTATGLTATLSGVQFDGAAVTAGADAAGAGLSTMATDAEQAQSALGNLSVAGDVSGQISDINSQLGELDGSTATAKESLSGFSLGDSNLNTDIALASTSMGDLSDASEGAEKSTSNIELNSDKVAAPARQGAEEVTAMGVAAEHTKEILEEMGALTTLAGVVEYFKSAVEAADALEMSEYRAKNVFGDGFEGVAKWAEGAAETLSLNTAQAEDLATQFGRVGEKVGLSGGALADFSEHMTSISANMAQFWGTDVDTMAQGFQRAMNGQYRAIDRYGLSLTDASVKEEAFSLGLTRTVDQALTPAQKQWATYQLIIQQTADKMTALKDTSTTLAGKMSTYRAELTNQAETIGHDLMPAVSGLASMIGGTLVTAFSGLGSIMGPVGSGLGGLVGFFSGLPGPIKTVVEALAAARIATAALGTERLSGWGSSITSSLSSATSGIRSFSSDMRAMRTLQQEGGDLSALQARGLQGLGAAYLQTASRVSGSTEEFTRWGRAAGLGSAALTGLKGAASGLLGALGGPWGLAIGAATVGLALWMKQAQKTKEENEKLSKSATDMAEAFKTSGGIVDQNVVKATQKAEADNAMVDSAGKAGVSQSQLTSAILDQNGAYDKTIEKLHEVAAANETTAKIASDAQQGAGGRGVLQRGQTGAAAQYNETGQAAVDTAEKLEKLRDKYAEANKEQSLAIESQNEFNKSLRDSGGDMTAGSAEAAALSTAFADMGSSEKTAADQIKGLSDALEALNAVQHGLNQDQAIAAFNKDVLQLKGQGDDVKNSWDAVHKTFDLNTDAGIKADETMNKLAGEYQTVAAAAMQASLQSGQPMSTALASAGQAAQGARDHFIELATQMGLSAQDANALADRFGLIPKEVTTHLSANIDDTTKSALTQMEGKLKEFDGKTGTFTLTAITQSAQSALIALGFSVNENAKDHTFTVTADTPQAQAAVAALSSAVANLPPGKAIDVTAPGGAEVKQVLDGLGIETRQNNDKTISVTAPNAPGVNQELAALGLKVSTDNNKVISVTQTGAEAVQQEIESIHGKTVTIDVVQGAGIGSAAAASGAGHDNGNSRDPAAGTLGTGRRYGGIDFHNYALGGLRPDIYHDGADVIHFAEKGTQGEAYIPFNPANHDRSVAIWQETGKRLGQQIGSRVTGGFAGGNLGGEDLSAADQNPLSPFMPGKGTGVLGLIGAASRVLEFGAGGAMMVGSAISQQGFNGLSTSDTSVPLVQTGLGQLQQIIDQLKQNNDLQQKNLKKPSTTVNGDSVQTKNVNPPAMQKDGSDLLGKALSNVGIH